MKKVIFTSLICASLLSINVKAQESVMSANLSQMFDEKKENEYSFSKKYENKILKFSAKVDRIDSDCLTSFANNTTTSIPCLKLSPIDSEITLWGLPSSVASAVMKNEDDLLNFKNKQTIILQCKLEKNPTFFMENFYFKDCTQVK
ncbi:hypothetical protein HDR59_00580 [bacterium]|nr:hypothetical protein [bacterium]